MYQHSLLLAVLSVCLHLTSAQSTIGQYNPHVLPASHFSEYDTATNTNYTIAAGQTVNVSVTYNAASSIFYVYYLTPTDPTTLLSSNLTASLQLVSQPTSKWAFMASSGFPSLTVHPALDNPQINTVCGATPTCQLQISIVNSGTSAASYQLNNITGGISSVNMDQYEAPLTPGQFAAYGYYVSDSIIPVNFVVRPTQDTGSDVDMYLSTAQDPFNFFMPSVAYPNHYNSTVEQYIMQPYDPSYRNNELVLQYAVGSPYSISQSNGYDLFMSNNQTNSIQMFGLGLFAMAGALIVFGLCALSTLIVCYRRRRAARLLRQWQIDHPHQFIRNVRAGGRRQPDIDFGASDEEISKLTVVPFHKENIPTELNYNNTDNQPTCTICLSEYSEDEPIILLQCGHYYHQQCAVSWLKRRKVCSLCLRPIDAVVVNHSTRTLLPGSPASSGQAGDQQPSTTDDNTSSSEHSQPAEYSSTAPETPQPQPHVVLSVASAQPFETEPHRVG